MLKWQTRKGKKRKVDLHRVYRQYLDHWALRCGSHSVACKCTTCSCLSFVQAFAIKGNTAANSCIHPATDILLIPSPTEGRRLSWPSWFDP